MSAPIDHRVCGGQEVHVKRCRKRIAAGACLHTVTSDAYVFLLQRLTGLIVNET